MTEDQEGKIEIAPEVPEDLLERVKKLRRILARCKKERQEYLSGWQRALADFQNYKKENAKEMEEFRKFAADRIIFKILPILDNLNLACDSLPESFKNDPWAKGVVSIRKQLENVLREQGIEEMPVEIGAKFDPARHEVAIEGESEKESGTIIAVVQKGYMLHGKIIRAARVKIAK